MFRKVVLSGFAAAALVVATSGTAEAVQYTGEFSKTGILEPFLCTGGVCVPSTLAAANAFDITAVTGTPTPGVPGPITGGSATLSFLALGLNGAVGTMNDFSFAGTGSAAFPLPPIISFETFGGIPLNFTLSTVGITFQGPTAVILSGTGIFFGTPGFDPTPGTFVFTTQTTQGTSFSFSATQGAIPTPEPGSMLLLGTGLFGLAAAARRRFSRT